MGKLARDQRLCKLGSAEFGPFQIRPGETIRIGRHKDNDIHISENMISRFHARITWDTEMDRPVVFDNGSQNGTRVDGESVRNATPLRSGAEIEIGDFVFTVELIGVPDTPAVFNDTGDMVTLFSDDGPELQGELTTRDAVRELLEQIESERRTGTLELILIPGGEGQITYCLGRVMAADLGEGNEGLRALEKILRGQGGRYRFSRELEPREDAMNLWVSDFLRSRNLDSRDSRTTQTIRNGNIERLFKDRKI
jgi:hypothetical protein